MWNSESCFIKTFQVEGGKISWFFVRRSCSLQNASWMNTNENPENSLCWVRSKLSYVKVFINCLESVQNLEIGVPNLLHTNLLIVINTMGALCTRAHFCICNNWITIPKRCRGKSPTIWLTSTCKRGYRFQFFFNLSVIDFAEHHIWYYECWRTTHWVYNNFKTCDYMSTSLSTLNDTMQSARMALIIMTHDRT